MSTTISDKHSTDVPEEKPPVELNPTLPPPFPEAFLEEHRPNGRPRGRLLRRSLVIADLGGLMFAFFATELAIKISGRHDLLAPRAEFYLFLGSLPLWLVLARLYGLYDRDRKRVSHMAFDDFGGVFHLVTVGSWVVFVGMRVTRLANPQLPRVALFWVVAITSVTLLRTLARGLFQSGAQSVQRAVILGRGETAHLVTRKLKRHPEYGVEVVGFADENGQDWPADLAGVSHLGSPSELDTILATADADRLVVALPEMERSRVVELLRGVSRSVQIDVVPYLYEIIGPSAISHSVEGLPLTGLPPRYFTRSARLTKRTIDLAASLLILVCFSPLIVLFALLIKLGSKGPVLFRQERLGEGMRPFTLLKFRSMRVGTDAEKHREYVRSVSRRDAVPEESGLFKLEREDDVTRFGRWLRKTSLDELPQLVNVLRGEMSLVGPRPCLAYETEHFEPQHFDRFLVKPGLTGLWQVTARATSTFTEALDLDATYVHSWSLKLDTWLLLRTPFELFRQTGRTR